MNNENRELLEEVTKKLLENALNADAGSDEEKTAFKQAMEATDRLNTLSKNDDSFQEQSDKLAVEREKIEIEKNKIEMENEIRAKDEEFKKKESKKNWIFRGVELVAGVVAMPLIINAVNNRFKSNAMHTCMTWETDGNAFTTTPGRSVKDIFKFK